MTEEINLRELIKPDCTFDPSGPEYKNKPIGMFHCPECGCMVLAGMAHGLCYSGLCGREA